MALLESVRLTLILALCTVPAFAQTASYTDDNPSVSSDGKKIAFMSDRDGDIEVYVMNVDGFKPAAAYTLAGAGCASRVVSGWPEDLLPIAA